MPVWHIGFFILGIVDESSMINLNLMYNMISKISDGTRIIFLGDRSQLPPIGPGKPFANLLSFLPCVVLTVPKRASENSGITKNAEDLLNNMMESYKKSDEKLSEKSKETNQFEWVKLMNNYKNTAEETILKEIIYTENV